MAVAPDPELDSIVGAALKALVESGAGREQIGAFAANFRVEVAGILGRDGPAAAQQPDLLELVRQAMADVLKGTPLATTAAAGSPGQRKTEPVYVSVQGRRTAVTVDVALLAQLREREGNDRKARSRVREVASGAPQDVDNRSAWVANALRAFLAAPDKPPTDARH